MRIVETKAFTKRITEMLSDDEYRALQQTLVTRPEIGRMIVGTGGARKLRWAPEGQGKSGGARVIYYYAASDSLIYLLLVYPKNEQETLNDAQKKLIRDLIRVVFS